MEHYIMALDQGTTSSRSIIFDRQGTIRGIAQKEFKQFFPHSGWVEHDPEEIWRTQVGTLAESLANAGINLNQVAGIGITNQRETVVLWERASGKPVYNAIVWQDRRTADYCDRLKKEGLSEFIQKKTGLVIDSYFSATKLKWILDEIPGTRKKAEKGELAFGTIDSWLTWKLTNGQVHITDVTNASRTLLYNIHTGEWDDELLKLFDIPREILPEIKPSSRIYGVSGNIVPGARIPVAGIAGDQQAALFGQQCISEGMVKNTYGTGCFMLMHTGTKIIESKNNLVATVAWQLQDTEREFALEGSVFIAGAVVQWLRDGLQMIRESSEIEELAATTADHGDVYFVPAFAGLGAPYWDPHARGTIFGLSRGSSRAQLAQAALQSIAYQTHDVLRAMEADAGMKVKELRVDGGASVNDALMQFQSDILDCRVLRPRITETTALGAAFLAGLAVGYWKSAKEISSIWKEDRHFNPAIKNERREELVSGWKRAVNATRYWSEHR